MVRLEDLSVFIRSADNGSLSAAARELNVSPAVASAALKRLEATLDTRLFVRSTRSLRLTPDGERYLVHAREALGALEAGQNAIARGRKAITGTLSLSMPSDLGRNVLLGWFDEFQALHPRVDFQLRVSDRPADLYRQPVDVALRYGRPGDSRLVALPLAEKNQRVLCASPDYFARHGRPRTPADLSQHNCLRFVLGDAVSSRWTFHDAAGTEHVVTVAGDRVADDAELVRRWAVAGKGLAYKSRLDMLDDLRAGRLEAALTEYGTEAAPLHLLCTHRTMLSPAVTRLRDFLRARFTAYLDVGGK